MGGANPAPPFLSSSFKGKKMPSAPIDLGYERIRESFDFQEIGSIRIPSRVFQRALQMEIGCEIISSLGAEYYNFKSYPASSFYGYAVIVFRGYISQIIPLSFGRQVLYIERNESAYALWESFKKYAFIKYDFFRETAVIGELATALGLTVTPNPYPSPLWRGFSELPLREIFIKCPRGTVFNLNISYERALDFTDMDGILSTPKSEWLPEPDRDGGLPKDGIQPAKAPNPDNPYGGARPASSFSQLGDYYNGDKLPDSGGLGGLNNPNPTNEISSDGKDFFNYDPRIDKWWVIVDRLGDSGACAPDPNQLPEVPQAVDFPPPYESVYSDPFICPDGNTLKRVSLFSGSPRIFRFQTSGIYRSYIFVPVAPPP